MDHRDKRKKKFGEEAGDLEEDWEEHSDYDEEEEEDWDDDDDNWNDDDDNDDD